MCLFVKQAKDFKLGQKLILSNTPINNRRFFDVTGPSAKGVTLTYVLPDNNHPAATRFKAKYGRITKALLKQMLFQATTAFLKTKIA